MKSISKLTPTEILQKYPQLEIRWHWKVQDIGVFLRCKLLLGHYDIQRRVAMIDEPSLLELIEYVNHNLDKSKVDI